MSLQTKISKLLRNRGRVFNARNYLDLSVSTYGEDLLIKRLLAPGEEGVYVDVGAYHPIHGSNTFRLYLKGWRGLTIDPNPQVAKEFRRFRPRDKHLTLGVAPKPGYLTYYEFSADQLNTLSPQRAADLVSEGRAVTRATQVQTEPLASIVERELAGAHIDLLNVDVEGLDQEVLESLNLAVNRPTVMIVEDYPRYQSFLNGSAEVTLEKFLRSNGYMPISQSAWSCILVAEDWRELFKLSQAFDEARVQNSYLPGQFEELPWTSDKLSLRGGR